MRAAACLLGAIGVLIVPYPVCAKLLKKVAVAPTAASASR